MTPFDVINGRSQWALMHGDCRPMLAQLPHRSAALLLTDIPYGVSLEEEDQITRGRLARPIRRDFGDWDKQIAEIKQTVAEAFELCGRVVRQRGAAYSFTSDKLFGEVRTWLDASFGGGRDGFLTWFKTNPAPNIREAGWTSSAELCAYRHRVGHRFNFPGQAEAFNVIAEPVVHNKHRIHPTEKPVRVFQRIIAATTEPGDLVIDPFAGSAAVGEAALRLGRRFIGAELEEPHHALAVRRLRKLEELNLARG